MRLINHQSIIIILIIFIGGFLRFYNLDWGQGIFAHPDEYHIVISVNQLIFPTQMHPHFFNYGTVTIYLIYFTQQLLSFLSSQLNASTYNLNPFLIGRFYSALFSALTIFIVYQITKTFLPVSFSLMTALLIALTPGLIQQAHFATPESALIFFIFGSLLFLLKYLVTNQLSMFVISAVFLGLGLGTKVSGLTFVLVPVLALLIKHLKNFKVFIRSSILFTLTVIMTFALTNPFILLDFPNFKSSFTYESGLALGEPALFYTRQFINTTPFIFQVSKILPFTLGPTILILGFLGVVLLLLQIKKRQLIPFTIFAAFLSLFVPPAFLYFVKWTRFLSPTFPFFAIFTGVFLFYLTKFFPTTIRYILFTIFLLPTIIWSLAFFSIYLRPDVRQTATDWAVTNIEPNSTILLESGNMLDLPLRGNFKKVALDFYNLEVNPEARQRVAEELSEADYFIIQSRRVFYNHLRIPNQFPYTASFYNTLFSSQLGFTKIKDFTSFPGLKLGDWKFEIPDEEAEETWSVFDHPVIRVFKKEKRLSLEEYSQILGD